MIAIPKEYTATVVHRQQLSPKIIFVQAKPSGPIPFEEGQFASFLIDQYRRPLSFANSPSDPTLDFIVDVLPNGVCSHYVMNLKIGDTIRFLAPYGRFVIRDNDKRPFLLIATGSGIAPIRGHLQKLIREKVTTPITLLFGNKHEDYAFLDDEFTELASHNPRLTFIPVLSDPSAQWAGYRGLVTQAVIDLVPNISQHAAYICGNPAMVKDMTGVLQGQGLPLEYIYREQF